MFLERGFEPNKLTSIGYADTRPELPSRTPTGAWDEAALGKNRRVVLRILEPKVDAIPMPVGNPGAAPVSAAVPAAVPNSGAASGSVANAPSVAAPPVAAPPATPAH
jgi:hypothetical protein